MKLYPTAASHRLRYQSLLRDRAETHLQELGEANLRRMSRVEERLKG
jgi:hypothetical protein